MADNNTLRKDLGPVTAYAIAVEAGFEGTQEEWVRRISSSVDQQSFDTLAASVASGDATLSDKIDTDIGIEAVARSAADTAEAAARSAADTAEATARETADTAQSGRIDTLSETVAGNDTTLRNILVHKPADSYSPDGSNGQVLMTHGDGTTEWSSFGQPTPEQAAAAVSAWLDAHPEATTTVVDGSITKAKLDSELKDRVNLATNSLAPIFQQATANDPGTYVSIADRLYYLPEGHTADVTWENTTKVEVQTTSEIKNLSEDVTGLKSAYNIEIPQIKKQKINRIITANANVFDKTKAITGKKISGGTEATDASAFYCEIPVVEGDVIRFPYSSTYKNLVAYGFDTSGNPVTCLAYTYFDANGNASNTELPNVHTAQKNGLYVYGRNTVDASGNLMFTDDGSVTIGSRTYSIKKHIVPSGVTLIKLNFSLSLIDSYMVTVNNQYPVSYQAYSEINAETLLRQFNGGTEIDPLNGKTLVSLGDSIAYGAGNPQGGGVYKSYANLIAEKHGMQLASYAVTGATLCPTLDANKNVCGQVSTLLSSNVAPDIILVEGGINDIHNNFDYETNRGAVISPETNNAYTTLITDSTKATVCGALEWIFCKLKMTYSSAIVIFIAVHRATSRNMTRQAQLHSDEMAICEKWAIPVVNIYENGLLNTKILEMRDAFTLILSDTQIGDGIHPNEAGYLKFYVPMIETKIAEFIH